MSEQTGGPGGAKGRLAGRVALVTAAGRGIGQGIALCLAQEGARIVVNSYSEDTTAATAAMVREQRVEALALAGDVTKPEVMGELLGASIEQFGQLDILVNNVGAGPKTAKEPEPGPLGAIAGVWDALYDHDLRAAVLMTETVIPHMVERRFGKIINISSIAGRYSMSDKLLATLIHPSYGAMKAALVSYTQTQAELLGQHNINVNAVCPGIVYTDAWERNAKLAIKTFPEFAGQDPQKWFKGIARGDYPHLFDRTPMRRELTVEDIGRAVAFLVSEDSMNITGQSLMVDGGMVKL